MTNSVGSRARRRGGGQTILGIWNRTGVGEDAVGGKREDEQEQEQEQEQERELYLRLETRKRVQTNEAST
jgi:hypothetical protein